MFKGLKVNFFLAIFSALFALYGCELIFSITKVHLPPSAALRRMAEAKKMGIFYDSRSVRDFLAETPTVYPKIPPAEFLNNKDLGLFPLSIISNTNSLGCNELGFYPVFKTDEYGFYNPPNLHQTPIDILIIGDSFAMGDCVHVDKNVAGVIRKQYPKIVNLGIGSSGPLIEYAQFKEYGVPLKPKKIVWIFTELNDYTDLVNELNSSFLKKYLDDVNYSQNLKKKQKEIDHFLINYYQINKCRMPTKSKKHDFEIPFSFKNFIKLSNLRYSLGLIKTKDTFIVDEKTLYQIFSSTNSLAKSWNGELFVVVLPSIERYLNPNLSRFVEAEKKLISILESLDIKVFNFDEVISKSEDPLEFFPFRVHGHYTESGYEELGKFILEKTKDGQ